MTPLGNGTIGGVPLLEWAWPWKKCVFFRSHAQATPTVAFSFRCVLI